MINLDELEKGLVCLVPKASAVTENSTLLTCHEYSVCDCTVKELIAQLRKAEGALDEIAHLPFGYGADSFSIAQKTLSELRGLGGGG